MLDKHDLFIFCFAKNLSSFKSWWSQKFWDEPLGLFHDSFWLKLLFLLILKGIMLVGYKYAVKSLREGSYLPSKRNSSKSEWIENVPLAILISTKQLTPCLFWAHQKRMCTISGPSKTCFLLLQNGDCKEEGSYLPSKRNSSKSERIENVPLAILISTKQFDSMLVLGSSEENVHHFRAYSH